MFLKRVVVLFLIICFCSSNLCFAKSRAVRKVYDFSEKAQAEFDYKQKLVKIPSGVYLYLRLNDHLDSGHANRNDTITVQLSRDWYYHHKLIAPEGSIVVGKFYKVKDADMFETDGKISIDFYEIQKPDGTTTQIKTKRLEFKVDRNRWKGVGSCLLILAAYAPIIIATGGTGAILLATEFGTTAAVEYGNRQGQSVEVLSGTEFKIKTSEEFEVLAYEYN